jgi:hypothetical protein
MITVETNQPVYSNAKGKTLTAEEKKARRTRQYESAKNVYGRAKDSGLLSALENIGLNIGNKSGGGMTGGGNTQNQSGGGEFMGNDNQQLKDNKMNPYLMWGLIIGGVAVTGFAVYWFGFRKKASSK